MKRKFIFFIMMELITYTPKSHTITLNFNLPEIITTTKKAFFIKIICCSQFLDTYGNPGATLFALTSDNDVYCGFCDFRKTNNKEILIFKLKVERGFQRQGIGSKLITYIAQQTQCSLRVNSAPDTVGFYEKNGFQKTGKMIGQLITMHRPA